MRKICSRCKEAKSLSQFYKRASKCKPCYRADVAVYRLENLEKIRAYDRLRKDSDEHRAAVRDNYKKKITTDSWRRKDRATKQEWAARNKLKKAAHFITNSAIKRRILIRQPCERCGADEVQAHHEDYNFPLAVSWLCSKCHGERHKEMNRLKRSSNG